MEWFFPDKMSSALKLLKNGYILHSGGTGILMGGVKNVKGFISLERLNLNYVKKEKNKIIIGATATFSDVINELKRIDKDNILIKSLSDAASTPLRNRITIGGSIAFSPSWSSLLGPLISLDAKIHLLGENKGSYKVSEFIMNTKIKKNSLIKEISFKNNFNDSSYFSLKRTSFDFSIFNISFVWNKKGKKIEDIRIALWGTKDKVKRLYKIEEYLKKENNMNEKIIMDLFKPEFHTNIYFSKEYLLEIAQVELLRILNGIYER